MRTRIGWIAGLVIVLAPGIARAQPESYDDFEPFREHQLLGFFGLDVDTGWQPPNSDIQVSFLLHAEDDVTASLPGEAIYDWQPEEVVFVGDEDEGLFALDVGVILDARVKFDLLGNQFESELIGPYEIGVFDSVTFTPYLLPGNPDRPAHIIAVTDPVEVFEQPLVDAVIASGSFVVDAAFDIDVSLQCDAIDVLPQHAPLASVQTELVAEAIAAPVPAEDITADATLRCRTVSTLIVLLYPGVQVQIGLEEFELTPFELAVPLVVDREDPFDFDPLPLLFEAPIDAGGTTGGETGGGSTGAGESGSAEGSGDGGSGPASGSGSSGHTGSGTDTDTDTGGPLGEAISDDGCGCRQHMRAGSHPMLWLWLPVLLGLRRRSRA